MIHQRDRILAALASDLDEIIANAAAGVARLDGARNAAQAIEHGVADAWQELPDLRTV